MSSFLGVDVGGTKVAVAAVEGGEALHAVEHPTPLESADALLACIEQAVAEVAAQAGSPAAVGVGVPSQIEWATGRVLASVNIPLADVPLREELGRRLGVPVYVDNDASCAALAEAHAIGAHELVMLTLGTGVGGGIVTGGRIFRGAHGLGGELGHVVVEADGPECPGNCPNRGCLEALCSGTALERAAGRKGRDVVAAARAGDADAQGHLDRLARYLGIGISNMVNAFQPETVAIGGGLSAAADLFLDRAVAEASSRALPALWERVTVQVAQAGNAAGMIGAGLLALQEHAARGDTAT
ncbi:MAG TPA: ROK family protein [Thermoleophilaceae bacterium]|nr:ROK family protein [Thermoleophilaceae bacterium]